MESRQSVSFSIPARYMEGIRQLSDLREESLSFIVRDALRTYLEANLPGWSKTPPPRQTFQRRP